MKKKTMAALIIGGALTLGGVSVYAANQIARSSAISEELAWNFAFVDAGVMPEEANVIKTEFDFEKGRFVYEIEFIANGVKYEYVVDSSDGSILERESEALPGAQIKPTQEAENTPASTQQATENKLISIDDAKRIGLEQAGLTAADVTFKKTKIEREDGLQVYAVEFYVPGKMKYEYTIDAITGAILEESLEVWEADDYLEYGASQGSVAQTDESGTGGGQSGGSGSSGQGGGTVSGGQGSGGSSSGQSSGGSSGGGGSTGSSQGSGTTAQPTPAPSQPTATPAPTPAPTAAPAPTVQDIGVERAKSIALSHAGVSASSVVFEKVKQDWEDGVLVYDVEFYVPGYAEYDYEIDAATGAIRDYDIDYDD